MPQATFFFSIESPYFAKKKTLKTVFDIRSLHELGNEHTLLLEVGKDYCSYAFLHRPGKRIDRLQYTSFDSLEMEEQFPQIVHFLTEFSVSDVVLCSAFPQALLVPNKFFNENYSYLDVVYEQPAQKYFHDNISEWQMVNMYALSKSLHNHIQSSFSSVSYYHAYTPAIKIFNGHAADNQLSVHFTAQHFRVLLKKDMVIHLAQTYYYKTSLDVIYYLLKICFEFHLSQQHVHLILSGLIEKDSNLFNDLKQYFSHVHFAQAPELSLPENQYPHYYFTSIYNLAACVS